jgi:hypothetical protein
MYSWPGSPGLSGIAIDGFPLLFGTKSSDMLTMMALLRNECESNSWTASTL